MLTNCRHFSIYKKQDSLKKANFKESPKRQNVFGVDTFINTGRWTKINIKASLCFLSEFDICLRLRDEFSIAHESVLIFHQSKLSWLRAWINIYWADNVCVYAKTYWGCCAWHCGLCFDFRSFEIRVGSVRKNYWIQIFIWILSRFL